jgi:transcriptional regulator with XRE-family HTH domain
MEERKISLNQLAERAQLSPASLSRILNRQRGLPSDKTILRLAEVLDFRPPERALIAAGRIPGELTPMLSNPQIPALLRATGKLSDTGLREIIKIAESLAEALPISPASSSPASPITESRNWGFEQEASTLLKEIQSLAGELKTDADTLQSYAREQIPWGTHGPQLTQAREHIDAIGGRIQRLQAIEPVTQRWQQRALTQLVPLAVELAGRMESVIRHFKENPQYLYAPDYTDHLTAIWERSGKMKETVDTVLEPLAPRSFISHH